MILEKYSFGIGDRFAHQGVAQLQAFRKLREQGVTVTPVWNKSNREHVTIGSLPNSTRAAADAAVHALGWKSSYRVDADHIGLSTVNRFLDSSDFFTIDVADFIGRPPNEGVAAGFVRRHPELTGTVPVPGLERPLQLAPDTVAEIAGRYLLAVAEAGRIYRAIANHLGTGHFVTEVSLDETSAPQTPPELLVILAALADEGVPAATIAPKFTGRFNKGVDYVGDRTVFAREFADDLAVIAFAVQCYDLPTGLKPSVHSGSDKFSLYPIIKRALARFDAGVHLKTAGTTWLEEVIGLAEAGGAGLELAQEIYAHTFEKREALCAPYASVIDIDPRQLPSAEIVNIWSSGQFVAALRHEPANPEFNPNLRQLIHVGYKVAAEMGTRYLSALEANSEVIARNVTTNLYDRHLAPLFLNA